VPGDESISDFLGRRFGRECVERLGEPLLAGIHAGDPEHLSMQATFPRFLELEARHSSLIRGLLAARAAAKNTAATPPFYSLRSGLVELVESLVARLPPTALRLRCGAHAIERDGDSFSVKLADGARVRARAR
jgi:oxygen-dependent protoporphyrinogen oxidase